MPDIEESLLVASDLPSQAGQDIEHFLSIWTQDIEEGLLDGSNLLLA